MKNLLHIEVIASVDNGIGELSFNYMDENDNLVGFISINKKGIIIIQTFDDEYKNIILKDASKLYGDNVNDDLLYFDEKPLRWKKAMQFIEENKLNIIYSEDLNTNDENPNKTYRCIRKI